MSKKVYRIILFLVAFIASVTYVTIDTSGSYHLLKEKTSNVSEVQDHMVYLGGMPAGIYLHTNGVMVVNTATILGADGNKYHPSEYKLKPGDYITKINQKAVKDKTDLIQEMKNISNQNIILNVRRNQELLNIDVKPIQSDTGTYMLGLWVRDDVQGLGTITYVKNHLFAALGHGIHDSDTNELLEIKYGTLYRTNIRSVSKGTSGAPGSMEGIIVYNSLNEIGTISLNTETGIFGTIKDEDALLDKRIPIQVATKDEIELGNATVRCKVSDEVKEYQIKITNIDFSNHEINKGMTIQITDPELLDLTGGIVQGMSGSPIIQNGKLIGAVTHVFIQDSKKGYGIFIENMIKN